MATVAIVVSLSGICLAQDTNEVIPTSSEEVITAQDLNITEPTLLPNSKFYFLKKWGDSLRMALTFGQENKAELNLKIASEKLLEAQKLAEKTNNPQILEKATELYNQRMEKIQENIAKFKGTATSSEAISKFLDKYTKQQVLHNQILEKLEGKVPSSTMEKIAQNRERHLEQFGKVMQKLEDKDKIQERLQKTLQGLKNNELKEIKNLEVLKKLKENFPTSTQQEVQKTIDSWLLQLREKLQLMPISDQEKVTNYLEKAQERIQKMDIINDIKNSLPNSSTIKQKLENLKGKAQNIANKNMVGGDKDEHGCIGSAGYMWCEAKQKCLRAWEEKCEQEQEQNQSSTTQVQNQNQNQNGQQ